MAWIVGVRSDPFRRYQLMGGVGGDDVLDGGAGADLIDGGIGFDTLVFRSATAGVALSLVTGGTGGNAEGDV
jgi:Ca2+-binding RTX toxin-like protein